MQNISSTSIVNNPTSQISESLFQMTNQMIQLNDQRTPTINQINFTENLRQLSDQQNHQAFGNNNITISSIQNNQQHSTNTQVSNVQNNAQLAQLSSQHISGRQEEHKNSVVAQNNNFNSDYSELSISNETSSDEDGAKQNNRVSTKSKVNFSKLTHDEKIQRLQNMATKIKKLKQQVRALKSYKNRKLNRMQQARSQINLQTLGSSNNFQQIIQKQSPFHTIEIQQQSSNRLNNEFEIQSRRLSQNQEQNQQQLQLQQNPQNLKNSSQINIQQVQPSTVLYQPIIQQDIKYAQNNYGNQSILQQYQQQTIQNNAQSYDQQEKQIQTTNLNNNFSQNNILRDSHITFTQNLPQLNNQKNINSIQNNNIIGSYQNYNSQQNYVISPAQSIENNLVDNQVTNLYGRQPTFNMKQNVSIPQIISQPNNLNPAFSLNAQQQINNKLQLGSQHNLQIYHGNFDIVNNQGQPMNQQRFLNAPLSNTNLITNIQNFRQNIQNSNNINNSQNNQNQ